MKKWPVLLWVTVFALVCLAGCGSNKSTAPTTSSAYVSVTQTKWKTYTSNELHIKFEYPSDWEIGDPTKVNFNPRPDLIIMDKENSTNLILNIAPSLFLAPSAEEANKQQADMIKSESDGSISGYTQLAYSPKTVSGYNGGVWIQEFTVTQTDSHLEQEQLYIPFGQDQYFLTITTSASNFKKYMGVFAYITHSVEIVK